MISSCFVCVTCFCLVWFRILCLLFNVKTSKRNRIGTQWACGYCYVPFPVVEVSFNPRSGPSFFFSCGPHRLLLLFCHTKYPSVLFAGIWDSHAKVLECSSLHLPPLSFAFVHFWSLFLFSSFLAFKTGSFVLGFLLSSFALFYLYWCILYMVFPFSICPWHTKFPFFWSFCCSKLKIVTWF